MLGSSLNHSLSCQPYPQRFWLTTSASCPAASAFARNESTWLSPQTKITTDAADSLSRASQYSSRWTSFSIESCSRSLMFGSQNMCAIWSEAATLRATESRALLLRRASSENSSASRSTLACTAYCRRCAANWSRSCCHSGPVCYGIHWIRCSTPTRRSFIKVLGVTYITYKNWRTGS